MKRIKNFELYEAQGKRCFYCGEKMWFVKGQGPGEYTDDHFMAKCKGHTKRGGNLVLAHYLCNQDKADRDPTPEECAKKEDLYVKLKKLRREKNCERKKINDSTWEK